VRYARCSDRKRAEDLLSAVTLARGRACRHLAGMPRRLLVILLLAGFSRCSTSAIPAAVPDGPTERAQADPGEGTCTGSEPLAAYLSDPKLCLQVFAKNLESARQLAFASNGDLFVNNGHVTVLWDADHDGASDANERALFADAAGLNHGLAFSRDEKFLYASSDRSVFRWAYAPGQRAAKRPAEVVVQGIPTGGHSTRTLAFDSLGRLYVSVGSAGNVDSSAADLASRSQIRRYVIPAKLPSGGLAYTSGELIARGMRNEVGLFVDTQDRLWGVENGRDNLSRADLGGDIHNDNPGEEINLVDGQGAKDYGYPQCFSEYAANGGSGRGTQWADLSIDEGLRKSDAYCRDPKRVHPPAAVMPAHWAPLGIIQYTGHALPFTGDLIISAHGSWNRSPATGRVLARAALADGKVQSVEVIVGELGGDGTLKQGSWNVRPVDVREGPDEAIYVSDDQGGRVLRVGGSAKSRGAR
jgi:glucose/arabinose dehydrogenase